MKRLLLLSLMCLPSWGAWSYYYPLTYAAASCGGATSSGFPALVSFNAAAMKDASHGGDVQSSAGADIEFFSDSVLTIQLPSELDAYDNANGIGAFWIKGSCDATAGGTIYMAVGNWSPPSRTTNPWDTGFKGIWHFGSPSTLSIADSTGNNTTSNQNGVASGSGKIGGGGAFIAANSTYLDIGNAPAIQVQASTMSAWINPNSVTDSVNRAIFGGIGTGDGKPEFRTYRDVGLQLLAQGVSGIGTAGGSLLTAGVWQHAQATYDGTTWILYLNGVSRASGTQSQSFTHSDDFVIGKGWGTNESWDGGIDEARISNVIRSADWIKAEYNNQNAPGNIGSPGFWTFGARTAPAIARGRVVVVQ